MTEILLVQYCGLSRRSTLSPPCAKVQMALGLKGVDFEVYNCKTPRDVKRFNSRGRVPALKIGDECFVDSSDILTEIDRRWPEPPLLPVDKQQRAQCLLLEDWADEVLFFQAVWLRWLVPASFEALRDQYFAKLPFPLSKLAPRIALMTARRRLMAQGTGLKSEAVVRRELAGSLAMLETQLADSDYLVGATITRADIAVAAILDQFDAKITPKSNRIDYAELPELASWLQRLHERVPSVAD
jgi:glutathione S-transferase